MIHIPQHISDLLPYKPGQSPEEISRLYGIEDVVKLASNENPLGASPLALSALQSISGKDLSLYPDGGLRLKEALSKHLNISPNSIVTYNGSDALLHLIMRSFTEPGNEIISSQGTFVGYYVATKTANLNRIEVPLTSDYRFDIPAICNAVSPNTRIVYIANANNPTGTYINEQEFLQLVNSVPEHVLIIMDEAYFEYSSIIAHDYPNSMEHNRPNIITLRTFSKVYGLASLRVGYAVASPDITAVLSKAKLPFDPGTISQIAAEAALMDKDFVQKTVELNASAIRMFQEAFKQQGWTISPTVANFSMIDCKSNENSELLYMELLKRGFITRPLGGFQLPQCIRISTGTQEQNLALISAMADIRQLFQ